MVRLLIKLEFSNAKTKESAHQDASNDVQFFKIGPRVIDLWYDKG